MANYRAAITEQDVRDLTGLTATEASDAVISGIMTHAIVQFNHDVQVQWKDWEVGFVSAERENDIDGSNTTFYTKYWPLGDYDDNGVIDTNDVEAYTIDSDGNRTVLTVSSIDDAELGKFTLSSAPPTDETFYITYASAPLKLNPLHPLMKLAVIKLTAAMVYTRIDASKIASFRVGKVAVMKQSPAFSKYYDDYKKTVSQILSRALRLGTFKKEV